MPVKEYPGTSTRASWTFVKTTATQIGDTNRFDQTEVGVEGLTEIKVDVYDPSGVKIIEGAPVQEAVSRRGVYYYDIPLTSIRSDGYYECQAYLPSGSTEVDKHALTVFVRVNRSNVIPPTQPSVQLATLIHMAQRRVDQNVLQTSGKWSVEWWTGLINEAKNIAAQETGFYWAKLKIAVSASQQASPLPAALAGRIYSVYIGRDKLNVWSEYQMDDYDQEWRYQSELPNQPGGDAVSLVSTSSSDNATTVTLYGVDSVGRYVTEAVAIGDGTTSETDWDVVHYGSLSAPAVGTVTIYKATGALPIATIASGESRFGELPTMRKPTHAIICPPYIEWYPVPDADYTAVMRATAIPPDLSNESDGIVGLPAQFNWVIAEGAAALASIGDLYSTSQEARENYSLQAFWNGIKQLKLHVGNISRDSGGTVGSAWAGDSHPASISLPVVG